MTKPSTHPGRVILALLIAPLIGCIGGLWIFTNIAGENLGLSGTPELLKIAAWVWLVSLPVSLSFGGLVHWALIKLKLWPVTAYIITGMLLGPLALLVWNFTMSGGIGRLDSALTWLGAITGGLTALTFRLIVHRSTDSASFPPPGTRPY